MDNYYETHLTGEQIDEALEAILDGRVDRAIEASTTANMSATEAKSWAVGGTYTRENENVTNAKYYAEMAAGGSIAEGEITVGSVTVGDRIPLENMQQGTTFTIGKNIVANGAGAMAKGVMSVAAKGYSYNFNRIINGGVSIYAEVYLSTNQTKITDALKPGSVVVLLPNQYNLSPIVVYNATAHNSTQINLGTTWPAGAPNSFRKVVILPPVNDSLTDIATAPSAEGGWSIATGDYAHAEGVACTAEGSASHAEGYYSVARNSYSHAEGDNCIAVGMRSHAEGKETTTKAAAMASHAEGCRTVASTDYQHVSGKYNTENNKCAVIVGNGSSARRSNAYTLDWDGNGWFAGKVTVGEAGSVTDPTASNELIPKAYFDKVISALEARIAALEAK